MKTTKCVSYLAILLPVTMLAQEPSPREIHDRFIKACQTLNFSDVARYVHSSTLQAYRIASSAVVTRAVEKHGSDAVVQFLQGTSLEELKSFSDQDYWAFLMASSMQFVSEKPVQSVAPLTQYAEGTRLFLVYPGNARLMTAPEALLLQTHHIFGFEQENGAWKLLNVEANWLEAPLYQFLEKSLPAKQS